MSNDLQSLLFSASAALSSTLIAVAALYAGPRIAEVLGLFGRDVHKLDKPVLPLCGFSILPPIFFAYAASSLLMHSLALAALLITAITSCCIGLVDDLFQLSTWEKTAALLLIPLPLAAVWLREGFVSALTCYAFVVASTASANSLDVLNGSLTGSSSIALAAFLLIALLAPDNEALIASLSLLVAVLVFHTKNAFPAKHLLGDSGSLLIGAVAGACAWLTHSFAAVALAPQFINAALLTYSAIRLRKNPTHAERPTYLDGEGLIHANTSRNTPSTLVKLLVSKRPLTEQEIVLRIQLLSAFSAIAAVLLCTASSTHLWSLL